MRRENINKAASLNARYEACQKIINEVAAAETVTINVSNVGTITIRKDDIARADMNAAVQKFCLNSMNAAVKELAALGASEIEGAELEKVSDITGFEEDEGYQLPDNEQWLENTPPRIPRVPGLPGQGDKGQQADEQ